MQNFKNNTELACTGGALHNPFPPETIPEDRLEQFDLKVMSNAEF